VGCESSERLLARDLEEEDEPAKWDFEGAILGPKQWGGSHEHVIDCRTCRRTLKSLLLPSEVLVFSYI
jgi:hypothetical protein